MSLHLHSRLSESHCHHCPPLLSGPCSGQAFATTSTSLHGSHLAKGTSAGVTTSSLVSDSSDSCCPGVIMEPSSHSPSCPGLDSRFQGPGGCQTFWETLSPQVGQPLSSNCVLLASPPPSWISFLSFWVSHSPLQSFPSAVPCKLGCLRAQPGPPDFPALSLAGLIQALLVIQYNPVSVTADYFDL